MTARDVAARRAVSGRVALLVAGDVVALALFVLGGRDTHGEAGGLAAAGEVARTAAPFVAAWLLAAAWHGAVRASRTSTIRAMFARVVVTWSAAFPLAAAGRALMLGRTSPWTFYLVACLVPLLMLLAWRVAFAVAERGLQARAATVGAKRG